MNNIKTILVTATLLYFFPANCNAQPETNSLQQSGEISLENIIGRIDHLAYDAKQGFIFVAALGNNSVEVTDLANKKVVHSIKNLHEPQGVEFIPENNSLFITNGSNGQCDVFNATTFQKKYSIGLGDDADNIRYDPATKRIYVGYGNGGIAIIDAINNKLIDKISLSGHPESFQIDTISSKLFVNIPDRKQINVIDLTSHKTISQWKLTEATANFPMALDEPNHRLFIGCRHPSKLLVINTETGKTITILDIDGDADDIFYNEPAKEIYVSCGSGYVDVFNQTDPNHYTSGGKLTTQPGARTSLFLPNQHRLIVAAPSRLIRPAELEIYKTK